MADGSFKAIEQVQVGDLVASEEIGGGKPSAKKVLRTFRNVAPVLLTLTLGNGERITTTPGHPFATSEHGNFVFAGDLPLGTNLIATSGMGSGTQLKSETTQSGAFPIFNFEVADFHTYFVGHSKLWVHNTSNLIPDRIEDIFNPNHYISFRVEKGVLKYAVKATDTPRFAASGKDLFKMMMDYIEKKSC